MKKKILLFLGIILLLGLGVYLYFFNPVFQVLESYHQSQFDKKVMQKPVMTYADIDKTLKKFPQVSYFQLDTAYLTFTKSGDKPYKKLLISQTYYVVKGEDIFRFLVGKFRVKDFMVKDKFYADNLYKLHQNRSQYLLIDKKLLYKLLDLQLLLKKSGYNDHAFWIGFANRYPSLNKEVGGASVSFHLTGKALDINILDINRNGLVTYEDKKIVLNLLETEVISNEGGVGRYPWSMTVHFDIRGYKARWNQQ
ncbi:MAG: DUF882 domain-containing protein [Verrucomicrobia bacterium]|nr:DUF882 domain-containing protein [Cytophagales bacterium]